MKIVLYQSFLLLAPSCKIAAVKELVDQCSNKTLQIILILHANNN